MLLIFLLFFLTLISCSSVVIYFSRALCHPVSKRGQYGIISQLFFIYAVLPPPSVHDSCIWCLLITEHFEQHTGYLVAILILSTCGFADVYEMWRSEPMLKHNPIQARKCLACQILLRAIGQGLNLLFPSYPLFHNTFGPSGCLTFTNLGHFALLINSVEIKFYVKTSEGPSLQSH